MKSLDELDSLGIWPCSLSTPNKSLFISCKGIRSVVELQLAGNTKENSHLLPG